MRELRVLRRSCARTLQPMDPDEEEESLFDEPDEARPSDRTVRVTGGVGPQRPIAPSSKARSHDRSF